ncbi:MAG TPA: hypothetical protein DCQ64_06715 [Candidatus Rokubacteria bacterium]|nr:hypothetical protein [Candidatus Rokubacteria bacterium]
MNFRWLHDEVAKLVDPGESFAIRLDIWDLRRGGVKVEVSIWDGHRHYEGPTPEAALATLRDAYEGPKPSADVIPSKVLMPTEIPF